MSSDRGSSSTSSSSEDVGTTIVPMGVPIDARPRARDPGFEYPDEASRLKEHLAISAAREHGLMPACDIRSPDLEDRVIRARPGKFVIFRETLKAGFRWPLHPFFTAMLLEHSMCPGQLVPNAWRMLVYFFIACRYLGIEPTVSLCRVVFELKKHPRFTCFGYLSTVGGFRVPKMASSLKGWREGWFYVVAPDPDLPFWPEWGVPDAEKFCEDQEYAEDLDRGRRLLVELDPLFSSMKDVGAEVIDLADVRGVQGMTFDPRALRGFVTSRPEAQPQQRPQAKKKGKKRHRGHEENPTGPGESSQSRPSPVPSPNVRAQRSATPPVPSTRAFPETIDLDDDETVPEGFTLAGNAEKSNLFPDLVAKYSGEVKLGEGVKVLELLTRKSLSVARGLAIQGLEEAQRISDMEDSSKLKDRRIAELEAERMQARKERDDAIREAKKAREEVGVAKDEAEEAKLELLQKEKEFEQRLEDFKKEVWEEFKTSEECDKLKGEYASGAYLHAFKEARSYLRSKHPEVDAGALKTIPSIAETLELSESEDGGDLEDVDEGPEDGDDVEIDITNLDPPLGHIE